MEDIILGKVNETLNLTKKIYNLLNVKNMTEYSSIDDLSKAFNDGEMDVEEVDLWEQKFIIEEKIRVYRRQHMDDK